MKSSTLKNLAQTEERFELTCAAGSWLYGVKEGETFCVFSRKGTSYKDCMKIDRIYCVLPRLLYKKFFWARYPKTYEIEGKNMFGILRKKDAYTTEEFLQNYKSKDLLN